MAEYHLQHQSHCHRQYSVDDVQLLFTCHTTSYLLLQSQVHSRPTTVTSITIPRIVTLLLVLKLIRTLCVTVTANERFQHFCILDLSVGHVTLTKPCKMAIYLFFTF